MQHLRVLVAGEPIPGKTRMVLLSRQLGFTCWLVGWLVDVWTFFCVYMGI
jgi:hypothetical protein